MGHEIVVYRDRVAIIPDMDLWTLRHFLIVAAEAVGRRDFADFIGRWEWLGPGVSVGVDLDGFLAGHTTREQSWDELLAATAVRVQSSGGPIPLDYLNAHVNLPAARFSAPQPPERFVAEIKKLRAVLPPRG